ncbi:hypothetical protein DFA_09875 [Cavenderia fasciculata]|uniref:Uncharacterized protein n=1 Tax=Cavenderia fasciculata TaxID=261658 RepID=F4Q8N3_CACFS|nr:uncharacterized protein DFA_09875 [Cavenderia fasciculata]EGG15052.1 hypothetical protein DFA_09875 [Cavenderia fasciculata]|eukprot:XP_004351772.1 hypothetical protein DFA_09875 [Cavenderia fasciculata]
MMNNNFIYQLILTKLNNVNSGNTNSAIVISSIFNILLHQHNNNKKKPSFKSVIYPFLVYLSQQEQQQQQDDNNGKKNKQQGQQQKQQQQQQQLPRLLQLKLNIQINILDWLYTIVINSDCTLTPVHVEEYNTIKTFLIDHYITNTFGNGIYTNHLWISSIVNLLFNHIGYSIPSSSSSLSSIETVKQMISTVHSTAAIQPNTSSNNNRIISLIHPSLSSNTTMMNGGIIKKENSQEYANDHLDTGNTSSTSIGNDNHRDMESLLQDWDSLFLTFIPQIKKNDNRIKDYKKYIMKEDEDEIMSDIEKDQQINSKFRAKNEDDEIVFDDSPKMMDHQQQEYTNKIIDNIKNSTTTHQDTPQSQDLDESFIEKPKRVLVDREIQALDSVHIELLKNPISITSDFRSNMSIIVNIEDPEIVTSHLRLDSMDKLALKEFMLVLIELDIGFMLVSSYFKTLLLPTVRSMETVSQDMMVYLTRCFVRHHTAFIHSVLEPLLKDPLSASHTLLFVQLIKSMEISPDTKLTFLKSLFSFIESNNQFIFDKNSCTILQSMLNLKLHLEEQSCI